MMAADRASLPPDLHAVARSRAAPASKCSDRGLGTSRNNNRSHTWSKQAPIGNCRLPILT